MKTIDKFRFAMAQALDDIDSIDCTKEELIEGLDVMQDMLIEAALNAEDALETSNVIQLSDYRSSPCAAKL